MTKSKNVGQQPRGAALVAWALAAAACTSDLDTGATLAASEHDAAAGNDLVATADERGGDDVPPAADAPAASEAPAPAIDGAPDAPRAIDPSAPYRVIHDMEEGRDDFLSPANVLGSWSVASNGGASSESFLAGRPIVQPLVPARGASQRAAHLAGKGLIDGADLFVDFHPIPANAGAGFNYADFSAYTGIAFWARAAAADPNCFVAMEDKMNRLDHEGFFVAELGGNPWPAHRLAIDTTWTHFALPFTAFHQGAFVASSAHRPLDPTAINSIHFILGIANVPFELWIDDLVLTCDGPCPTQEGAPPVTPAELCDHTGGTVEEVMCCPSTQDFPDLCLAGACACSPASSTRATKVCRCPAAACFVPGRGCVGRAICTPGSDQTCNDDPEVSSFEGHCNADGTCTCAAGLARNPATGRCGR